MTAQRLRVLVDVEPTLAAGMSHGQVGALVLGIACVRMAEGVQVRITRSMAPTFAQPHVAALRLHALADEWAAWAEDCGGLETATGRWWLDRAALLRIVAGELVRRPELWTA